MRVGVPREIKNAERRVGLTPASVRELVAHGHEVVVERHAGVGIGASDADYAAAGATLHNTAAEVLHYDSSVTALEIDLSGKGQLDRTADRLRTALGPAFVVKTRYQKNELMYRTNASEKVFTFIVLSFIGLIGAFNIIASLTMMMIEKRRDMGTLTAMGATPGMLRNIFFSEGLLIVVVGVIAGLLFDQV